MISIAIDGPSGSGKSTFAREIAHELGCIYVDTGALYRGVGLAILQAGKNPKDEEDVNTVLSTIELSIVHDGGEQKILLGGGDVSAEIRGENVGMAASDVSAFASTRAFLLETQRELARKNNVVMDGRDIGTVVLPNADVKIFLTASVAERAQRRLSQLLKSGVKAELEQVRQDVEQRDHNDTSRAIAPLKKADDAIELDTTGFSLEQTFGQLLSMILGKLAKDGKKL